MGVFYKIRTLLKNRCGHKTWVNGQIYVQFSDIYIYLVDTEGRYTKEAKGIQVFRSL